MHALLFVFLLALSCANAFLYNGMRTQIKLRKVYSTLDVGDFENVAFSKVGQLSSDIGQFRVEATVAADDMNGYLDEYKEEMKDRKVIFPGFRPGKIPPSAMIDIRKYLVSHSIETIIGQLCNLNGLMLCDSQGADVPFPEDSYLEQIMLDDKEGNSFVKRRDAWKEGKDFTFRSEFYAKEEQEESSEPKKVSFEGQNVIDVESIEEA